MQVGDEPLEAPKRAGGSTASPWESRPDTRKRVWEGSGGSTPDEGHPSGLAADRPVPAIFGSREERPRGRWYTPGMPHGEPVADFVEARSGTIRLPGTGCALRPWRDEDVDQLAYVANDRGIARNLTDGFPHPYRVEDARAWLAFTRRVGRHAHLAITVADAVVGSIGVDAHTGQQRFSAHFGYFVGRDSAGRGIATAAVDAFVPHLFATTDLERIEATVYAWNPASARVLEKCGFRAAGRHARASFKQGEFVDTTTFARLRPR